MDIPRADYLEAWRLYKERRTHPRERTRYHALVLVYKGYTYEQIADVLLVDAGSVSRWMDIYQQRGLAGLKNNPRWGGEHGQRRLTSEQITRLGTLLGEEAMPGTEVGSGWTLRAVVDLVCERFCVRYSQRGMRKILHLMGWSWQRGRALYIKRTADEQARFEAETHLVLAELAASGGRVTPLAGDQTRVYLEGTVGKRWSPIGQQPRIPDSSRTKYAENIYGAEHLGTGAEVAPFSIDFQDASATVVWLELVVRAIPRGTIVLWLDSAPHLTDPEVEEWLDRHRRVRVIRFPKYTPEENPKERTWKALKEEVSHHCFHPTKQSLSEKVDEFYQTARRHTVSFLQRFGYFWENGRIHPLPSHA
jgi:transposase